MITQKRLKELLHYDPDTGIFVWKVNRGGRVKKGQISGTPDRDGYILITVDYIKHKAHRLAYFYMKGFTPDQVDHINQRKNDNSWKNLRPASSSVNNRNRPISCVNKCGAMGVCWHKNRWYAQIRNDGKQIHLGAFKSFFDAVCARKSAEIKFGYHTNHGMQKC